VQRLHKLIVEMSVVQRRQKLVILGSGWGGFSVLKKIDGVHYDVHVISPRNHFLFTPLLASTTVGTLEFRCVTEAVRTARPDLNLTYVQASCTAVDPISKSLHCVDHFSKETFNYRYDKLVIAVGAESATWGVKGVGEHAFTLKSLADARAIRNRIMECFERASNPVISIAERRRLLHFVVCGGGPTNVELSAG
jgi:NADH dehydrogenase FAD-containing subunit